MTLANSGCGGTHRSGSSGPARWSTEWNTVDVFGGRDTLRIMRRHIPTPSSEYISGSKYCPSIRASEKLPVHNNSGKRTV